MKKYTIKLENGFVRVTYYDRVPKYIERKYDKLRLELVQDGEKNINIFMYPDEALLIVNALMQGWLHSKTEGVYPPREKI